jgi:hypothetical protein
MANKASHAKQSTKIGKLHGCRVAVMISDWRLIVQRRFGDRC